MKKYLLVTYGTEGDFVPFLAIAKELKSMVHNICILTHCVYEKRTKEAGIDFMAMDTPAEYEDFLKEMYLFHTPSRFAELIYKHFISKIKIVYQSIVNFGNEGEIVIVARAIPGIAERIACEKLKAPLISINISPSDFIQMPIMEKLLKKAYSEEINSFRSEIGLPPILDFLPWIYSSSKRVGLWHDWFAEVNSELKLEIELTGFAFSQQREGRELDLLSRQKIASVLSNENSPVLITHGTSLTEKDGFYNNSIEACLNLGHSCIVVSQHEKWAGSNENVHFFKYLPFEDIIPYTSAVIHHGGINTLALALSCKVPQLILADSGEREDNGAKIKQIECGDYLPVTKWPVEAIQNKLEIILKSSEVKMNCEKFSVLINPEKSIVATRDIIEQAVYKDFPLQSDNTKSCKCYKNNNMESLLKELSPEKRSILIKYLGRSKK